LTRIELHLDKLPLKELQELANPRRSGMIHRAAETELLMRIVASDLDELETHLDEWEQSNAKSDRWFWGSMLTFFVLVILVSAGWFLS